MRNKFDLQLSILNRKLKRMCGYVERVITYATKALVEENIEFAQKAIEYETEVSNIEKEIEALCLKLLLQQQPVASDLRVISSALKVITDMKRIRSARSRYCIFSISYYRIK